MEQSAPAEGTSDIVDLLIEGARYGDLEDIQSALRQGVSVDAQDEQGRTALHMASANGFNDIVKALIGAGADVSISNAEGNTPLHWAACNGQCDAMRLLIMHGASASALNKHERTPVDEALGRPCQDAVLDVVNSFHKAPVFAVAPQAGPGPELEDEFGDAEDAEMGDAASEAANEALAPSGEIKADAGRQGG